jgi:3-hydroxyisobutyrate dehydrogenase-like beta-hydroxyacid dehydrogenase
MARIGFIGLGNMGLPMAQNLLKAGHQVEGVDVNPASVEKLRAAGGAGVETAKSAAARGDAVITMLPSGREVREVYLGSSGIIENANPGTLLIDCSTIDVETARAVAAEAEKKGLLMLDAPVSGGVGGATAATLTFMVGGSAQAFARAESILQKMGKTIVHADLEALLGAVPQELVRAMIQAITAQESAEALRVLAQLLDQGHDLRAYCAEVVEYLRNMLVMSVVASPQEWQGLIEASAEDLAQMAADACSFSPEPLQELFAIFTQAEDSLRLSAHPRFVLETAAVRATRLLRPADGRSPQSVQLDQTTCPPQSVPVRTGQPVSPARSADPTLSSPPRPPQPTAPTSAAPMTSKSTAVENTVPPRGLSTNPPNGIGAI